MSWWLISIAVWFAVAFGSILAVIVAAEVRERRKRKQVANDNAVFEALVAELEPGPRTLA